MKGTILYAVLLVFLLTGCKTTVLEFPVDDGIDPTKVFLSLTLAVDPTLEPYFSKSDISKADEDTHDVRWIIEIFRDEISGDPVESRVISCDPASDGNHVIQTDFLLHASKYHVVAWMDYVDNGSLDDKYYSVNTLSSIKIPETENYIGDEERKDAYVGREELDFSGYQDTWDDTVSYTMILERPMAQIEFVTTDIDKLLEAALYRRSKSVDVLNSELLSENLDPSSLQITVEYGGYFPSGFNVYTDKPNDAREGVSFSCTSTQLSDTEAHLAGDHVFVNGNESAVTVNLIIKDSQGNLLNTVAGINVPIVRGKLTTIRDEFVTSSINSGIGINPGFEGDIDIVIPD